MLDAPLHDLQRTHGLAAVGLAHDSATRLATLRQVGAAKAFLPRVDADHPEVVFLNTAGGLTGGDQLSFDLGLADGGRATATTQTAERIYRQGPLGPAKMNVRLQVGRGARLDWLPQETILFEDAALDRETSAELGAGAQLLTTETLVLGRAAMGEEVTRIALRDKRRVVRDGRPVMIEPLAFDDDSLADGGPAGMAGARALATLGFFAEGAEDALGPVRALLSEPGVTAHASGWDGKLLVRAMAAGAAPLRKLMARVAAQLRGRALPRVWQV